MCVCVYIYIYILGDSIGENLETICMVMTFRYNIRGSTDKLAIIKIKTSGTSLVAQWLRICLPMQGSWVRALVWEDPTCHRAAKPMSHNY